MLLHPRRAIECDRHELGGISRPVDILVALVCILRQSDRGEGHEFGPRQSVIEPIVHRRIRGLIQDRPVSERPRPILHATRKPGHHVTCGEEFGNLSFDVRHILRPEPAARNGLLDLFVVIGRAEVDVLELLRPHTFSCP